MSGKEKEKEQEDSFTFVDKRRAGAADEEKQEIKHDPAKKQPAPEITVEPLQEEMHEELSPEQAQEADVASLLKWFTELLYGNALLWMGLVAHPQTGRTMKDMKQAKLAIDTLDFMCERLSDGHLSEMEKKNFTAMLSGLKMEFVNQSKVF